MTDCDREQGYRQGYGLCQTCGVPVEDHGVKCEPFGREPIDE
jgi:hypothetical protein